MPGGRSGVVRCLEQEVQRLAVQTMRRWLVPSWRIMTEQRVDRAGAGRVARRVGLGEDSAAQRVRHGRLVARLPETRGVRRDVDVRRIDRHLVDVSVEVRKLGGPVPRGGRVRASNGGGGGVLLHLLRRLLPLRPCGFQRGDVSQTQLRTDGRVGPLGEVDKPHRATLRHAHRVRRGRSPRSPRGSCSGSGSASSGGVLIVRISCASCVNVHLYTR